MNDALISLVVPCFNGGEEALATVLAAGKLPRPPGFKLEAIIVDDASTDGSTTMLAGQLPAWARLVQAPVNLGRGGAINLGASGARGTLLLVLDCDCVPSDDAFLLAHMATIENVDASIGDIRGHAEGFWGRYQSEAAHRRGNATADGLDGVLGLTTANIMLRATAFRAVGGFDPRYRRYGFEDRDLLLRLHTSGARLKHTPAAVVDHADNLDLPGICRKLRECGRYSAPLFRGDHPQLYARLGYGALDATLHPFRGSLLGLPARFVFDRSRVLERWLQHGRTPYRLRALVARLAVGLAYLAGTIDSTGGGSSHS
jgi:GT2 family glycosyltransferase